MGDPWYVLKEKWKLPRKKKGGRTFQTKGRTCLKAMKQQRETMNRIF